MKPRRGGVFVCRELSWLKPGNYPVGVNSRRWNCKAWARGVLLWQEEAAQPPLPWHARGNSVAVHAASRPPGLPGDVAWLYSGDNAREQARALHQHERLRQAEGLGFEVLGLMMPARADIGPALADRLRRAADLGDGEPDSTQTAPGGAQ